MDQGRGQGEVGSLFQLRASRFLRRLRDAVPDESGSSAGDGRFQRGDPRRSGSDRSRVPHLLGKQDRLVRAEGRDSSARQVPAGYPGARRYPTPGMSELAGARLRLGPEVTLEPLLDLAARCGADLLSDRLAALE